MTILWWVLVALCLSVGFLGCFISKFPGPLAVVLATVISKFCLDMDFEWYVIAIVVGLVIAGKVVSVLFAKIVQKLHEYSKRGNTGIVIGSIIGLAIFAASGGVEAPIAVVFIAVIAFVLIPFLFSFVFELSNKNGAKVALKSATSATVAYLGDTFFKLVVFGYSIYSIFEF